MSLMFERARKGIWILKNEQVITFITQEILVSTLLNGESHKTKQPYNSIGQQFIAGFKITKFCQQQRERFKQCSY